MPAHMTTIALDMETQSMSCDSLMVDDGGFVLENNAKKIISFPYDLKSKSKKIYSDGIPKYNLASKGKVVIGIAGDWASGLKYVQWLHECFYHQDNINFSALENAVEFFSGEEDFECIVVIPIKKFKAPKIKDGKIPKHIPYDYYEDFPIGEKSLKAFYVSGSCILSEIKKTTYAIGSGQQFALSALELGHNSESAVEFAKRFDTSTGGAVYTIDLQREIYG